MGERADNSLRWVAQRAAKAAVAGALCAAGARWAVRSWARRTAGGGRVLILSYHLPTRDFVGDAREVLPSLLVDGGTLRRQLQQLAREREIVSMDEVCRRLAAPPPARGPAPTDVAAVTFDDGYAGVHAVALPVLRDLRIPACVYVATGLVGTGRRFLHDRLFAALSELRRRRLLPEAAGLEPRLQRTLDLCAAGGAAGTLDVLISRCSHDVLGEIAGGLERRLGLHEQDLPEATRVMGWDDVRALAAADVDVGGHTVDHVMLANVSLERARAEVRACREAIAERLGAAPRHFAYPNGYWTRRVRWVVEEAGFTSAVTTEDVENRRGDDLFTLKRKTLWENTTLGATRYSAAVPACNLDGVFGVLGWGRTERGERPDGRRSEREDDAEAERAAV